MAREGQGYPRWRRDMMMMMMTKYGTKPFNWSSITTYSTSQYSTRIQLAIRVAKSIYIPIHLPYRNQGQVVIFDFHGRVDIKKNTQYVSNPAFSYEVSLALHLTCNLKSRTPALNWNGSIFSNTIATNWNMQKYKNNEFNTGPPFLFSRVHACQCVVHRKTLTRIYSPWWHLQNMHYYRWKCLRV